MKSLRRFGLALTAAVGLLAAAVPQAQAGVAFTIDNTQGQTLGNPPFTLGFTFDTNQAIRVTRLGLFDSSQNGLAESHAIGLWDSGGNLLVSGTISSGTSDPLTNQFRYIDIAPLTLAAGQQFSVGAVYVSGNDAVIFPTFAVNFATDPAISFVRSGFQFGGTLADPVLSFGADPAYFGPNFQFNAVPEPTTLLMAVSGIALIGCRQLRRKCSKSAAMAA